MNNLKQIKLFIFTGAPGSEKTSVIKELEKLGYIVNRLFRKLATMREVQGEAERRLIKECEKLQIIPKWSCNVDNRASLSTGQRVK